MRGKETGKKTVKTNKNKYKKDKKRKIKETKKDMILYCIVIYKEVNRCRRIFDLN